MTIQSVLTDPASTGTWTLVPDRSAITFGSKTLWGLVPVNGRFTDVTGEGSIGAGGAVSGRLQIRVASVKTGIGKRDEHLCSPDFFDTAKFPLITVEVNGLGADGALEATLRVRDTALPLPLTATVTPLADGAVQVNATTQVDRTRWGVSGNTMGMIPAVTTLTVDAIFAKV
ncbi:MAG: YceI family protein [Mycobacteriaceae bacterium]|jgi:polyisoprenoid-binding protein YceI